MSTITFDMSKPIDRQMIALHDLKWLLWNKYTESKDAKDYNEYSRSARMYTALRNIENEW